RFALRLISRSGRLFGGVRLSPDAAQDLGEQAIGLAPASLGDATVLESVLGLAGVAAHLGDVVADHAHDAVVHDHPATGAIVVDHVAEADASFHGASKGGVRRASW